MNKYIFNAEFLSFLILATDFPTILPENSIKKQKKSFFYKTFIFCQSKNNSRQDKKHTVT